ncbi:UDP-glucose--hexose-1-phosphate uridylyltransferase [Neobacillus notoginsengisoli]|uniref:Galactose-1-phosphate uridylyltransferase n=1 Tax=Neobacillus notoginsengisoli TaxID=1578198 RepID=A0A417YY37_9BACI|nr:UDP-glucose--hexose-1-phosphate uridylyltransferase [Neobacillus notoginsengisoli]RHW42688.1 UDP-glucose--hexose-1-phosphate uridylyltransferase [Neobacillus notoginsengisoli]
MDQSIYGHIQRLLEYGLDNQLIKNEDIVYARNRIMALLQLDTWEEPKEFEHTPVRTVGEEAFNAAELLDPILDWAYENGQLHSNTITERDILDTEIMDCLMPRPSEVIREFTNHFAKSPEEATDYFYDLSKASNYIRTDRIKKNIEWKSPSPYGEIDITINLSKPEKDPKEIALLKNAPVSSYPACLLCRENEGYRGTVRNPARATHRVIPVELNGEGWYFQYSPYVYYNEHSIVFRGEHVPMKISKETFVRLLDFTEKFPHYFVGSNADLPIVGGSILSHDHFQGGRYEFAIERADVEGEFVLEKYPSVTLGLVNWPMSVIRLRGNKNEVVEASYKIWRIWQQYGDASAEIHPFTDGTPHNTVTPIARRRNGLFEMDIVLRNNRTSEQHPDGIFHPHQELHHIKKENIGLIEVMGLAVLPGRLATELKKVAGYLLQPVPKESWDEDVVKHYSWANDILEARKDLNEKTVMDVLKEEVGKKFVTVLEHAGVFKRTEEGKQAFAKLKDHVREELRREDN